MPSARPHPQQLLGMSSVCSTGQTLALMSGDSSWNSLILRCRLLAPGVYCALSTPSSRPFVTEWPDGHSTLNGPVSSPVGPVSPAVIVSLTWIYVFFPFFLSYTENWEALNISTLFCTVVTSYTYLQSTYFSSMFARCEWAIAPDHAAPSTSILYQKTINQPMSNLQVKAERQY